MIEYESVNLKKWTVLAPISEEILESVVLVHVFGYQAESAYFVTADDKVFAVGQNVFGRLGIGNSVEHSPHTPIELNILSGKHVICFATGSIHSLALTEEGAVYSWGCNNFGELGYETSDLSFSPQKVIFPNEIRIKQITTADRYSLALTTNNELYHWGDINWDSSSKQDTPLLLKISLELNVINICCGAFHAAAVTDNGKVLTWGANETGQLGNDSAVPQQLPQVVGGQLKDQFVVKVVCSILATLALTYDGILYAWGHNNNCSLSVGMNMDVICTPQRVIMRKNIVEIAANNLQSVFCAKGKNPHEVILWAQEDEEDPAPKSLPCSSILEAFYGVSTPVVRRKGEESPQPSIPAIKGSPRDIGKVLFNVEEYSDLQIELYDGVVYVHSIIMRAFCDHFKTLLDENWSQGRNIIKMTQYNAKAYRTFLKYIYTGVVEPLEGTEIIALCDIAMSYLERELKSLCQEMFKHCLNISNVAQLYALAARNQSELLEACIKFTSDNLEDVILSDGFESLDPVLSKSLVCNAVRLKHGLLS